MVPPVPDAVALPSEPPLQLTLFTDPIEAATATGSLIVALAVAVQPLSSVTVTLYVACC